MVGEMTPVHLLPKVRSRAIMDFARGQPCTLRVSSLYPGHFCAGTETSVMCHLPVDGKGVSTKVSDTSVAIGCCNCHDILDGRDGRQAYIIEKAPTAFMERLLRAHCETISRLVMGGIITVIGVESDNA